MKAKSLIPPIVSNIVNFVTQLLLIIFCCVQDAVIVTYHYSSYYSGSSSHSYLYNFFESMIETDFGILLLIFLAQVMFFLLLWSFLCLVRAVRVPCHKLFITLYSLQCAFIFLALITAAVDGQLIEGLFYWIVFFAHLQLAYAIVNRATTKKTDAAPETRHQQPAYQQPAYQQPAYQPPVTPIATCRQCGSATNGAKFYPNCGSTQAAPTPQATTSIPAFCPQCGAKTPGTNFCSICGTRLTATASTPANETPKNVFD